jgi:hypothetical protein
MATQPAQSTTRVEYLQQGWGWKQIEFQRWTPMYLVLRYPNSGKIGRADQPEAATEPRRGRIAAHRGRNPRRVAKHRCERRAERVPTPGGDEGVGHEGIRHGQGSDHDDGIEQGAGTHHRILSDGRIAIDASELF